VDEPGHTGQAVIKLNAFAKKDRLRRQMADYSALEVKQARSS